MAIRLPNAGRSAAANAAVDRFDAGAGPGVIEIRTGAQPASAEDAATGTLLVTIPLNDPAFAGAVDGVKTLDNTPVPSADAVAAGTAGWFRGKDSDGNTVVDGSATATGGGGDLTIDNTNIASGQTVRITGGTMTMPGG